MGRRTARAHVAETFFTCDCKELESFFLDCRRGEQSRRRDERSPICPACGVTMGMVLDEDGTTRYVCLEYGFSDEMTRGCLSAR